MPEKALKFPGVRGSQISRQSAHEIFKVVSPKHRPSLPHRKYSWYSFLLEAESKRLVTDGVLHTNLFLLEAESKRLVTDGVLHTNLFPNGYRQIISLPQIIKNRA